MRATSISKKAVLLIIGLSAFTLVNDAIAANCSSGTRVFTENNVSRQRLLEFAAEKNMDPVLKPFILFGGGHISTFLAGVPIVSMSLCAKPDKSESLCIYWAGRFNGANVTSNRCLTQLEEPPPPPLCMFNIAAKLDCSRQEGKFADFTNSCTYQPARTEYRTC